MQFDLNSLSITHVALLGATGVAIGAYWEKIKNLLSYISSFLIHTVLIDDIITSRAVVRYLNKNYKIIPRGYWNFVTIRLPVDNINTYKDVGFKKQRDVQIYFRFKPKFEVVKVKTVNNVIEVTSIWKFCDLQNLIITSKAFYEDVNKRSNDNFMVRKIFGTAGVYGNSDKYGVKRRNDPPMEATADKAEGKVIGNSDNNPLAFINIQDDVSITHEVESYRDIKSSNPFRNVFLSENVQYAVDRAKRWRSLEDWYKDRSIPWRLGMLFYGIGGTGKSITAKRIAYELGLPVYQYFLNTLTDKEFIDAWDEMLVPCAVLFEDFDNVFHGRIAQTNHKLLSFDCVLNTLSGVNSQDGILLFVTTNEIDKIDPAMGVFSSEFETVSTRPGRIDIAVEFGLMEEDRRYLMAGNILRDWKFLVTEVVAEGEGMTSAQFQELCVQRAIKQMSLDEKEKSKGFSSGRIRIPNIGLTTEKEVT